MSNETLIHGWNFENWLIAFTLIGPADSFSEAAQVKHKWGFEMTYDPTFSDFIRETRATKFTQEYVDAFKCASNLFYTSQSIIKAQK